MFKNGEFVGQSVEEILAYLEEKGYAYEYEPETEDVIGTIYVGGGYYADHYEIDFYNGVCDESYNVEWD